MPLCTINNTNRLLNSYNSQQKNMNFCFIKNRVKNHYVPMLVIRAYFRSSSVLYLFFAFGKLFFISFQSGMFGALKLRAFSFPKWNT